MKVIAVDFDGTLCDSAWPEIGKENQPVINELLRRQADGDRIILWTCRTGVLLDAAVAWCTNHGLNFDAINSNVPERITLYGDDPRKVSADEYWDDRAVLVKESSGHKGDFVQMWARPGGVLYQKLLEGTSPTGAEPIQQPLSLKRTEGSDPEHPLKVFLCAQCAQDMIGTGFWHEELPRSSDNMRKCRWCRRTCFGTEYNIAYRRAE